ncbi:MAG TPA: imidazoleglycerol-phosphate dehydratase HisB [Deltaproteobacteria bacterium]|nr:MAG: imidazoleglycerol-phosphate dehydratase HisB [Deltaproteobacteria bacterium]HDM74986.1 imidazoleglycerol-phosphate dehydratase HisB [Deltaproteobacteria bacterium]
MSEKLREASIVRSTKETSIEVKLAIDGSGEGSIETQVPFLNHMLNLFATHGNFDLTINASGDTYIDDHHTVEDVGICLGKAFSEALGDKSGINRYGSQIVPMDEALARVVIDISNRPFLVYRTVKIKDRIGTFETELVPEFFRAFVNNSGITLHVIGEYGDNSHHVIEAIFKAWGRAMDEATRVDPRLQGKVKSSKGVL